MADVTGGTPPTNASPFDVAGDIQAVYDHFGASGMFTVADAASLPASGNWVGRLLMTGDTKALYMCTALPGTWKMIYRDPASGTIAWATGWSAASGHAVERTADHVVLTFSANRTSAVTTAALAGTLPVGFRPSGSTHVAATIHGTGDPVYCLVAIDAAGEIRPFFGGSTTQTRLSFSLTFPIA